MAHKFRYRFCLTASPTLVRLQGGIFLFTALLIVFSRVPAPAKLLILIALSMAALLQHYKHRRQIARIVLLEQIDDRQWQLGLCDGSLSPIRLGAGSYITRHLVVLQLQGGRGMPKRLLLLPDALPPGDFRRLRVRAARSLKKGAGGPEPDDQGV